MRRALSIGACLLALSGCSADNILGGSVQELFSLEISRVDVYRNDQAMQVTYYSNRGTFLDVVVRIAVSLQDVTVKPGIVIPLQGEGEKGHQRTSSIVLPRQVAMYLSCVMSELSSTDIGRAFGGKDHSTVLHARKKIEKNIEEDPFFLELINKLQADIKIAER